MGQAVTVVDAFTDTPFTGNPAGVCVLAAPTSDDWMLAVAAELNLSETAFVVPRGDGEHDLRWFTPTTEVDLCGHATLASAHVLGGEARFHTRSGLLQVPSQSAALLTVLMLRGPQTAGELRIASERLHRFSDISAVQGFLEELAARPAGALVVELARLPGARENRWAHTLSGTPQPEAAQPEGDAPQSELAALTARVQRLEAEVAALKALVARTTGTPPQSE